MFFLRKTSILKFCLIYSALIITSGCNDGVEINPKNLKEYYIKYNLNQLKMDIPLNYHYSSFQRKKHWAKPKDERILVDFIEIEALLPNINPFSEKLENEFRSYNRGKKIRITLRKNTHYPLSKYLEASSARLHKRKESKEAPGLFYFEEFTESTPKEMIKDIFILSINTTKQLFKIECHRAEILIKSFPACTLGREWGDGFYLEYTFSREYLKNWKDIDLKSTELLNSFLIKK